MSYHPNLDFNRRSPTSASSRLRKIKMEPEGDERIEEPDEDEDGFFGFNTKLPRDMKHPKNHPYYEEFSALYGKGKNENIEDEMDALNDDTFDAAEEWNEDEHEQLVSVLEGDSDKKGKQSATGGSNRNAAIDDYFGQLSVQDILGSMGDGSNMDTMFENELLSMILGSDNSFGDAYSDQMVDPAIASASSSRPPPGLAPPPGLTPRSDLLPSTSTPDGQAKSRLSAHFQSLSNNNTSTSSLSRYMDFGSKKEPVPQPPPLTHSFASAVAKQPPPPKAPQQPASHLPQPSIPTQLDRSSKPKTLEELEQSFLNELASTTREEMPKVKPLIDFTSDSSTPQPPINTKPMTLDELEAQLTSYAPSSNKPEENKDSIPINGIATQASSASQPQSQGAFNFLQGLMPASQNGQSDAPDSNMLKNLKKFVSQAKTLEEIEQSTATNILKPMPKGPTLDDFERQMMQPSAEKPKPEPQGDMNPDMHARLRQLAESHPLLQDLKTPKSGTHPQEPGKPMNLPPGVIPEALGDRPMGAPQAHPGIPRLPPALANQIPPHLLMQLAQRGFRPGMPLPIHPQLMMLRPNLMAMGAGGPGGIRLPAGMMGPNGPRLTPNQLAAMAAAAQLKGQPFFGRQGPQHMPQMDGQPMRPRENLNMLHLHPTQVVNPLLRKQQQHKLRRDNNKDFGRDQRNTFRDEYAGLMTPRDKGFLADIQRKQLEFEDPYIDDYYYVTYTSRKLAEKDGPCLILPERSKQPIQSDSTTKYIPRQFVGSLGKIQVSSVSRPRKIIELKETEELTGDSGSECGDTQSVSGKSTAAGDSSVKSVASRSNLSAYRKLLLNIERNYVLLLSIDDEDKRIPALPEEARKSHEDKREELCNKLFKGITTESVGKSGRRRIKINTDMACVRKGLILILRSVVLLSNPKHKSALISNLLELLQIKQIQSIMSTDEPLFKRLVQLALGDQASLIQFTTK